MSYPIAIGMPGLFEWIIIGGIGLLIFGKRLPEVGRSVGQMIVQFKRGMKDVETEVDDADRQIEHEPRKALTSSQSGQSGSQEKQEKQPAHKFDPYTGKPIDQDEPATQTAKD